MFKIPNVDHSPLDLHGLFKAVTKRGGFDEVSHNRLWTRVTKDVSIQILYVMETCVETILFLVLRVSKYFRFILKALIGTIP